MPEIGSREGLLFEWSPNEAGSPTSQGGLRVLLRGEPVWYREGPEGEALPVPWDWLDLFEHLAKFWPWLALEESYPIPVRPTSPLYLLREAEQRWQELPAEQEEQEDEAVTRFLIRHDLAEGLHGLYLPSLILLRQGEQCLITTEAEDQGVPCPLRETLDTLESLGEHLARTLSPEPGSRSGQALDLWQRRRERVRERAAELHSGLSTELLKEVAGQEDPAELFEIDTQDPLADSPPLAAARMTNGTLDLGEQRRLLGLIHALPAHSTPELERLSRLADEAFRARDWSGQRVYEQSYWLAAWLRGRLNLDNRTAADPEAWLGEWGVEVREEALPAPIDALAVWGERHGPAILLNTTEGAHPAQPAGRRITLAHEIAHLLIDWERALPAAELVKIGGQDLAPATPEVRARAFAAELLLPRETAAQYVQDRSSLDEAIEQLINDFGVGPQVAGWQIRNSSAGATLSATDQRALEARLNRAPAS